MASTAIKTLPSRGRVSPFGVKWEDAVVLKGRRQDPANGQPERTTRSGAMMASKYHNLSNEALADEIGRVDAIAKAAEAELTALKAEFKARGVDCAEGELSNGRMFRLAIGSPRFATWRASAGLKSAIRPRRSTRCGAAARRHNRPCTWWG
jgi:hypothetical protein